MKKKITVNGHQCDGCGKETEYAAECRNCDKTFCLKCMNTETREYQNKGMNHYYCRACDNALLQSCKDETHYLLRLIDKIQAARSQAQADFTAELDRLSKQLEAELAKERMAESSEHGDELPF